VVAVSEERDFYVTTEEGGSLERFRTTNPRDAALMALRDWDLIAEPGFTILVFDSEDAKVFPLELTVRS
jgi:hypothetical protein